MIAALCGALLLFTGCNSRQSALDTIYSQTGAETEATVVAMQKAYRAGTLKFDDLLTDAHTRLENPTSADAERAVQFAKSVLILADRISPDLPTAGEFEILWFRIGRLAFNAANQAREHGNTPLARSVVLLGPQRWQTDAYWRRYPDHDALAAYILYESGEAPEALHRLRSRPELLGQAQEAYNQIIEASRR